jgi:hypothetical protein
MLPMPRQIEDQVAPPSSPASEMWLPACSHVIAPEEEMPALTGS